VASILRSFPPKPYTRFCLSHACHMLCPPQCPRLDLTNDIWGCVQIMKLLIVHLSLVKFSEN
jgi:hypothetical protein